MAAIAAQNFSGGLLPTFTAATAGGDTVPASTRHVTVIKNTHASIVRTITVVKTVTQVSIQGYGTLSVSDVVIVIPAVDVGLFFFSPNTHSNGGIVSLTYDDETSVEVASLYLV